jgi:GMP synthase (glutamine-hydrolysing)
VFAGERREVGWAPITLTDDGVDDPLFAGGERTLDVFHMHGDTYELPPDARNLARSTLYEQQAFRWGDLVYGFQFHIEFTEAMIGRLVNEAESRAYITAAGVDPAALLAQSATRVRQLADVAPRVFGNFFSQCGL